VLAGLAWNLSSMLVFRVIQAIASSADYPTAMAIITVTFPAGRQRGQALGIWSSVFAAGIVFGPLIGGPLIDTFGWRSVFLLNLPVGIAGLLMALAFIKESVSDVKTVVFDWWGAITLGSALSSLVLVLDQGVTWGWLSLPSWLCYISTIVFITVFYYIERDHPEPIVDLKFFKNSVFVNALVNNFIVFMGMMGSVFLIPVFAQNFLGYSATESGYLFMPMALGIMIGSPLGGSLIGRVNPKYVIFASTLVAAVGIFLLSGIDPRTTALDIMIPMTIMAFGLGFGMPQRTGIVAAVVPESEIGAASAILALARNIAGAFGIALFATILNNSEDDNVISIAAHSVVRNLADYKTAVELVILKAEVASYAGVFVIAAAIIALGAFAALFVRNVDMHSAHKVQVID
jgi:DHA2 family multidrug resistance protein